MNTLTTSEPIAAAASPPPASTEKLSLVAPAVTLPGQTGQVFVIADDYRIVDVASETPNAAIVRLLAGTADVRAPEGGTWKGALSAEDVRVSKGQYINLLVRNDSDAPVRLRAVAYVVPVKPTGDRAVRAATTLTPRSLPAEIAEHGEPVRFLLGRGLVPYVTMYLQGGGAIPRQMHSAVLASFEGTRMVRTAKDKPMPSAAQEVEVILGEHVRAEIARAVRFRTAPRMSMADRAVAAEAIAEAASGRSAALPEASTPDRPNPDQPEMTFVTLETFVTTETRLHDIRIARNEALAEATRLRVEVSRAFVEDIRAGAQVEPKTVAMDWDEVEKQLAQVTAERDDARQKVEQLKAHLQARSEAQKKKTAGEPS